MYRFALSLMTTLAFAGTGFANNQPRAESCCRRRQEGGRQAGPRKGLGCRIGESACGQAVDTATSARRPLRRLHDGPASSATVARHHQPTHL